VNGGERGGVLAEMKNLTHFIVIVGMGMSGLARGGDYAVSLSGINEQAASDGIPNLTGGLLSLGKYVDQGNRHRVALEFGCLSGSETGLQFDRDVLYHFKTTQTAYSVMMGYSYYESPDERVCFYLEGKVGVAMNKYSIKERDFGTDESRSCDLNHSVGALNIEAGSLVRLSKQLHLKIGGGFSQTLGRAPQCGVKQRVDKNNVSYYLLHAGLEYRF
jgi:hypothetical protein